jgi:hypothetical protein
MRCCRSDGGCLALWSRPTGGGFKPPTGALAEDRCAERRGKRRGSIASGMGREDERWVERPSAVDVSKVVRRCRNQDPPHCPGISLEVTRLLPGRHPAYRQHDPDRGASTERVKARPDTAAVPSAARGRPPSGRTREEPSTVAGRAGGPARSSCEARAYRSVGGGKGRGRPGERMRPTAREEPRA